MWKLGFNVLGRYLWFSFALNLCGFLLTPGYLINKIPDDLSPWIALPVKGLLVAYVLGMIPVVFYLAAKWTGMLQGRDTKEYNRS